jgi:hypothetical protein
MVWVNGRLSNRVCIGAASTMGLCSMDCFSFRSIGLLSCWLHDDVTVLAREVKGKGSMVENKGTRQLLPQSHCFIDGTDGVDMADASAEGVNGRCECPNNVNHHHRIAGLCTIDYRCVKNPHSISSCYSI